MSVQCPVSECPAAIRENGCGFWPNRLQCRHPVWRDEWNKRTCTIKTVFTAISAVARLAWKEQVRVVQGRLL